MEGYTAMTLQDTMRQSVRYFGCLYPNLASVYDHLFFTLGNGYRWIGGELVENYQEVGEELTPWEEVDRRLADRGRISTYWYPHVGSFPHDIKPDWRAGYLDAVRMRLADPVTAPRHGDFVAELRALDEALRQ